MNYRERTGRGADFRVRYRWITKKANGESQTQRPYQHMRCDFAYEADGSQSGILYMIWPEFEDMEGEVLPEGSEIAHEGLATMWILDAELRRKIHSSQIEVGVRGFFQVGSTPIASAKVVEVLDLHLNLDLE